MFRWRFGTDPTWRELERLQRGMDDLFHVVSGTRKPSLDPCGEELGFFRCSTCGIWTSRMLLLRRFRE